MQHYVYIYCDQRKPINNDPHGLIYQPFYVGMGVGERFKFHLCEARWNIKPINPFKTSVIRKIIRETGNEPIIVILQTELSKEKAAILEQTLIAHYGRRDLKTGCLTNLTNGGDGGNIQYLLTPENRKKRQDGFERYLTPERRAQLKQHLISYQVHEFKEFILHTPENDIIKVQNIQQFCEERKMSLKALYHTKYRRKPCSKGKTKGWLMFCTTD